MIKYNKERLPRVQVQGQVWHSSESLAGQGSFNGEFDYLMGTGGITYNFKVGDLANLMNADHLEPGVTTKNSDKEKNNAYLIYSCIGNKAVVASGDAKDAVGYVTGKHGGCNHVLIHFSDETLEKLTIDDKINVYAQGLGIKLTDYPEVFVRNTSPELIEKLNIIEDGTKLKIGVAKIIPACLMGSGIGSPSAYGDYDVTLFDEQLVKQYNLRDLRIGDIVALENADNRYGRTFINGAMTIGVIVHSDCVLAGHGPGVTTLMTTNKDIFEVFIDENANLNNMFTVE